MTASGFCKALICKRVHILSNYATCSILEQARSVTFGAVRSGEAVWTVGPWSVDMGGGLGGCLGMVGLGGGRGTPPRIGRYYQYLVQGRAQFLGCRTGCPTVAQRCAYIVARVLSLPGFIGRLCCVREARESGLNGAGIWRWFGVNLKRVWRESERWIWTNVFNGWNAFWVSWRESGGGLA